MLRTIDRYVIREIIPPFLLSLLIFTFILEIPPVMRHLETLVAKGVTWQIALQIILTLIPQALGVTIPMALLTGILIGLGRLSSDRETVALLACGVSPYRLLRPILLLAAVATAATLYVLIEAIPNANHTFNRIAYEIITKRVEQDIQPRVFFEDFPGWVLYSRDEAPDGGWKDVLVADTRDPKSTKLFLAARGRLYLAPDMSRVDLILSDGTQYGTGTPRETTVGRFAGDLILGLDPKTVFPRMELPRGVTEQTIAQLQATIEQKRVQQAALNAGGQDVTISPHPEILGLHQKFSLPAACLVFALIGLALGLTVAREGKMAGFVVGIVVIFAYYIVMYLGESSVKGYYTTPASIEGPMYLAHLGRWLPNIVLGLFGVLALIWRARFAERGLPISIPASLWARLPTRWGPAAPAAADASPRTGNGRRKVVVVVRFPRLRIPALGVLDQYISTLYVRMIGLSFLALLGLFYISTFIDRSDKMFKGQASPGMMFELLALLTPQFVYFVIPIAALLSALVTFGLLARTSELTVMKACGISLYRIAVPVVVLSIGWSAILFGLEQNILAPANRRAEVLDNTIRGRPTTMFNPLSRRWLIGTDGAIYHYSYFDAERQTLNGLSMYRLPENNAWRLASHTYAPRAVFNGTAWIADAGWTQNLLTEPPTWTAFARRSLAIEPPDYFHTEQPEAEMMTVQELREVIKELDASGFNAVPAKVELQRKLAFPAVTLVMTLLAIPFGVTTGRRGAIYGIGIGIVIALSYWVVFSIFVALGRAGILSPPLAAWTPNIIVFACAGYGFLMAKT
jgi:LPS export ABC transporter permease LptG/LPS export ABC transporter permease LptF